MRCVILIMISLPVKKLSGIVGQ